MLARRLHRFLCAARGILHVVSTQTHARIHLVATLLVTVLGFYLGISSIEWVAISIAIGLVWVAEALNTAIELLADALHPENHPLIGKAKDVAAGAVLLASIAAGIVGSILFIPHLIGR